MKIKSEGKQVFNIPNTPEGQKVYEMMKKYKNKGYYFDLNGRGKTGPKEADLNHIFQRTNVTGLLSISEVSTGYQLMKRNG